MFRDQFNFKLIQLRFRVVISNDLVVSHCLNQETRIALISLIAAIETNKIVITEVVFLSLFRSIGMLLFPA